MSEARKLNLTRQQLALFLPNHETIVEFERLFARDNDLATLVLNIIEAAGLNDDGTYSPDLAANYIAAATSLASADSLLDTAIFDETRPLIVSVTADVTLDAKNQSVLANATAAAINITMPDPAACFANSRSFRIGITKIDTSANVVGILPNGTELIAGAASEFLDLESEVLNFITDGTDWYLEA